MKQAVMILSAITLLSAGNVSAQCAYNNTIYLTGSAPTVVGNTIIAPETWAGEFNRVTNMQAGYTYEVSTCGSTTFDSELTIFPSGGGTAVAYDDDGCGVVGGSSKILFTPATTGDYDIQLNEYSCITNSIEMDMTVTLLSTGGGTGNPASLVIPVVVHVVYKNATENISDTQIQSQIDALNADYRKLNIDFGQTPSVFQGVAADMSIEFCLASVDPNGNPTNGIVRVGTSTPVFSQFVEPKSVVNGGSPNWNPHAYLNMWVCDLDGGLLGYATFPTDLATEPQLDGVVMDYQYFGTTGTATAPFNKGRTATHEIGHWLHLRHIWGDNFCGDDFVSDTPTQQESNGGCPNFPHVSCSNGPDGDMFMNYMDYTEDACMFMFTNGQKQRAHATISNIRTQLASSGGCGTTGVEEGNAAGTIQLYPNPANTAVTVTWASVLPVTGIEIMDMTGRKIHSEKPNGDSEKITINLQSMPSGVYLVRVESGKGATIKKLVVQ